MSKNTNLNFFVDRHKGLKTQILLILLCVNIAQICIWIFLGNIVNDC